MALEPFLRWLDIFAMGLCFFFGFCHLTRFLWWEVFVSSMLFLLHGVLFRLHGVRITSHV